MFELGANRYGKSRIRLVTVDRSMDRHELRDLTVDVSLEGDFTAAHVDGDNANIVATDTMKNTVYAFARDHLTGLARGARPHARPALRGVPAGRQGRDQRCDSMAGRAFRSRPVARLTPSPDPATSPAWRSSPRPRRVDGRGRGRGPDDHEDHAVFVRRLPARQVDDAAPRLTTGSWPRRSRRSGATERRQPSPASTSMRPGRRSIHAPRRYLPTTTARRSRRRSGSWPRRCSSGSRRDRRGADGPSESPPLDGRPRAVRDRQRP